MTLPVSSVHGDSPGKNIGVSCRALLQGIFPTQGLNPGLLNCRQILYHLTHQGSQENTLLRHQMQDLAVRRTAFCLPKFEVITARKQFIWAFQTSLWVNYWVMSEIWAKPFLFGILRYWGWWNWNRIFIFKIVKIPFEKIYFPTKIIVQDKQNVKYTCSQNFTISSYLSKVVTKTWLLPLIKREASYLIKAIL